MSNFVANFSYWWLRYVLRNALRWLSLNLTDDKSTLVQVLGVVRQQVGTWANVDQDVYRHLASPGHNELSSVLAFERRRYMCNSYKHLFHHELKLTLNPQISIKFLLFLDFSFPHSPLFSIDFPRSFSDVQFCLVSVEKVLCHGI